MRRLMDVERALALFFEEEEAEGDTAASQYEPEEDSDDEAGDPSFLLEEGGEEEGEEEEEEERRAEDPLTCVRSQRATRRTGRRATPTRSRSRLAQAAEPHMSSEPWKTGEDADRAPAVMQRRVKDGDGHWAVRDIPIPTPITAHNKNMGGVDLSDQLIQYYSTHRKTARWYRTVLLHFLDIATTNAYILHREMCKTKQVQPMTHKDFMVELGCQLCGVDKTGVPQSRRADHVPAGQPNKGRKRCQRCLQVDNKRNDTPWMCQACGVALCVLLDRNCFLEWHK
ncbi:piggyBac transposable element-derived protein 4-like [Xyrichtys novacula]|uniref:PiggyBac transposable element-derived protein 4-like n=1 Tax=Xyrichtys novacula TaxID=13765 RepID=A0AAV1EIN0_XYRNO|nr:piggyBac transposable element-derived protein 4-like [Xyrichtys novacula]